MARVHAGCLPLGPSSIKVLGRPDTFVAQIDRHKYNVSYAAGRVQAFVSFL